MANHTVTQADREAVESVRDALRALVRSDQADPDVDHVAAQAFAFHRIESTRQAIAERDEALVLLRDIEESLTAENRFHRLREDCRTILAKYKEPTQ